MESSLQLTRELFLECNWNYDIPPEDHYGYSSVMSYLQKISKEMLERGKAEHSKVLEILARAASMMLEPSSINEPFKAYFHDFQSGRRSTLPEDFTEDELAFFDEIISDINEPWLKSRLADILWLLKKPRNIEYAKLAIASYISLPIDGVTWVCDVNNCWERAARICIQIKWLEKLKEIKASLFAAFCLEYPTDKFMTLWIAELLDKIKIDNDFISQISLSLQKTATNLQKQSDFHSAIQYFELASKKYKQYSDNKGWLESLIGIAECYQLEADSRSGNSNIIANSFYENAIQAYRRIPTKHRNTYGIEEKIRALRQKITVTGQASLSEMGMVRTPGIDISDMVKQSIEHVADKQSPEEALMYFTALFNGANYKRLEESAKKTIQGSFFSSFFGSIQMSSDGRVVAKTPAMNLNADEDNPVNQAALHRQIQQQFSIEVQLVVEGQILPALRQLLMEHRFTKDFMVAICNHSPIVPQNRDELLGYALWLGFEYEFGAAIYLLCPQVEHIIRTQLKDAGAHTSNLDKEGIENENGLSTLMDLPEAHKLFGDDLTFELKSVFTDSLGFNLRNEVAHGLLDDDTSSSIHTIYAWWMVLKLVITSISNGTSKNHES
jgi:tetratricopeptide (TPR) repeat protein